MYLLYVLVFNVVSGFNGETFIGSANTVEETAEKIRALNLRKFEFAKVYNAKTGKLIPFYRFI